MKKTPKKVAKKAVAAAPRKAKKIFFSVGFEAISSVILEVKASTKAEAKLKGIRAYRHLNPHAAIAFVERA